MILQLEDYIDYLKVLHTQYEFVFLFDHSCGHDCGQDNGLNSKGVNVGFRGKHPKMHSTLIWEESGYRVQFKGSLRLGGVK